MRAYSTDDVAMVRDLATDPYVPLIGSLPVDADERQVLDHIGRQRARLAEAAVDEYEGLLRSYMEIGAAAET